MSESDEPNPGRPRETARDGDRPAAQPAAEGARGTTPETGESGGPKGLEPTRYGDWERNGRCIDF